MDHNARPRLSLGNKNNRHKNDRGPRKGHSSENTGSHDSLIAKWKREGEEVALMTAGGVVTGTVSGSDAYTITVLLEDIGENVCVFKHSIETMMTKKALQRVQSIGDE